MNYENLTAEQLEQINGGSAATIWKVIKEGIENAREINKKKPS